MMISPAAYREGLKGKSYPELMQEREELMDFLHQFETEEIAGNRSNPARVCRPSPEVRYQMFLDYLSVLCGVMSEKYNREYVWGERTLRRDIGENL